MELITFNTAQIYSIFAALSCAAVAGFIFYCIGLRAGRDAGEKQGKEQARAACEEVLQHRIAEAEEPPTPVIAAAPAPPELFDATAFAGKPAPGDAAAPTGAPPCELALPGGAATTFSAYWVFRSLECPSAAPPPMRPDAPAGAAGSVIPPPPLVAAFRPGESPIS